MPVIKLLGMRKRESQGRPEWAHIQTHAQAQADQLMSLRSCVQIASCAWAACLAAIAGLQILPLALDTDAESTGTTYMLHGHREPNCPTFQKKGFDRELR